MAKLINPAKSIKNADWVKKLEVFIDRHHKQFSEAQLRVVTEFLLRDQDLPNGAWLSLYAGRLQAIGITYVRISGDGGFWKLDKTKEWVTDGGQHDT